MKICFKCQNSKSLKFFYKHEKMRDGHLNKCIECTKKDVNNNDAIYDNTEKGVIRVIYKTQKRHNKLRGFGCMPYSKDELRKWLYDNDYKRFYNKWVNSGYEKDKKPSVDRLDTFKGYSFKNIKLDTWLSNKQHQTLDILNGVGTGDKRCKPTYKIDHNGELISSYVSYSAARRDMGYSLEYSIKNKTKCRNGFYWKFR